MDDLVKTWIKGWVELLWKATIYWWGSGVIIFGGILGFSAFLDIKKKLGRK